MQRKGRNRANCGSKQQESGPLSVCNGDCRNCFKRDALSPSKVRPAQHPGMWRTAAEGLCDAGGVASAVRLFAATMMARGRRRVYARYIDATGKLTSTMRYGYTVSTGSMGGTCASSYAQAMPQLMVTAMLTNVTGGGLNCPLYHAEQKHNTLSSARKPH